jgi:mono/diheme cytochrome c family protein
MRTIFGLQTALITRRLAAVVAVGLCAAACGAPSEVKAADSGRQVEDAEATTRVEGRAYAEQNCAACHAIDAGQGRSPNPNAPTFEVIASTPGMTIIAVNAWLHTPHKTMPNLKVDQDKIEPLSAYILTLRNPSISRALREKSAEPEKLRPLNER